MEERLELTENGIVCDNPKCDWEDKSVKSKDTASWLNRPCPKCGENLLTQEDLDNYNKVISVANFLNSISKEDHELLAMIAKDMAPELLESDFLKDCKGLEILDDPSIGNATMRISTHKEIKAKEIVVKA